MIDLFFSFWVLVFFFALLGSLRGWQKETLALTTMIAMMAIFTNFGFAMLNPLYSALAGRFNMDGEQWAVLLQVVLYTLATFFGYQIARPVAGAFGGRFGERLRVNLERRFIGFVFGFVNGLMYFGALWGFLEYQLQQPNYVRWPEGTQYVFPSIVTRPPVGTTAYTFADYLPQGVFDNPQVWLILFFVAFFFVIIALI